MNKKIFNLNVSENISFINEVSISSFINVIDTKKKWI